MSAFGNQGVVARKLDGWVAAERFVVTDVCRHLYPSEDRALLACDGTNEKPGVPLVYRLLDGFLAREGMRKEKALKLTWRDVDLERGAVKLDENKRTIPARGLSIRALPMPSDGGARIARRLHRRMRACSRTSMTGTALLRRFANT